MRHPSWTSGGNGTSTFGVIVLLSSEISPDAWAARNGETRDDGEMARLIGVPVLALGRKSIFDRPPTKLTDEQLAAWEKAQFKRLHQKLPNQRGIAFREYLNSLLSDVGRAKTRAQSLSALFEKRVAKPNMSPVALDIVAKFGLLYAGGMLAVEAGVLPLKGKAILVAAKQACRDALAELPNPQDELHSDLTLLRERLASGSIVNLASCSRKEARLIRSADGFHQLRDDGKGQEFVVRAQQFAKWFGTPMRVRRVLEWLDDQGFLDHGRDRTTTRSNKWAQKQVTWPDGTRVRSVCLYAPHGIADFDVNA
jgi:hypothetical protein